MHTAVDEKLADFRRNGFTVIPGFISAERVDVLLAVIDVVVKETGSDLSKGKKVEIEIDRLWNYPDLLSLATAPAAVEFAVKALSWNIYVPYFGLMLNPPQPPDKRGMVYHQDGGRIGQDLHAPSGPMLSFKFAVWLTDGTAPTCGSFMAVPGSHLRSDSVPSEQYEMPGETAVPVKPGDAIVFDRRLWHARRLNSSNVTRKVVFFDYSFRWLAPKCRSHPPADRLQTMEPIGKQFFAAGDDNWRHYAPKRDDVPLRSQTG